MPVDRFEIRSKTGSGLTSQPGDLKRQVRRFRTGWRHLGGVALGVIIVAASSLNSPASAANVLERSIAAAQPCKPLKVRQSVLGVKVELGIDKLDFVKVDTLEIRVSGDLAEASAVGTLACRTSDDAPLQGGFSAKARIHLQANLATCVMNASSIDIVAAEGEFGDVVTTFEPEISAALRNGVEKALKKLCAS
ncbi:hypothetical protein [Rhizobium mesosinicum]|uniref:Uncharacterized protein n=1 Tax=Rhizobium mesosinicum TaxID=335017 RepID=A0ABS7H3I5_9HYPH|nr:hypothetical protein [Rhizobium mesosinicum]MBW9056670.1 hypothetical protein [Rhizobium mesosinicum]